MSDIGYSGAPLAQKLGLKDGQRVLFVDLPETLADLVSSRAFAEAGRVTLSQLGHAGQGYDVIHIFTAVRAVLEDILTRLMQMIARDGTIWVSWPKKSARVATDITEDVIRDICLPLGLVDVKVCAVDAVWSGLKLVIRKEFR